MGKATTLRAGTHAARARERLTTDQTGSLHSPLGTHKSVAGRPAIALITDKNYMLPTLSAAISVERHLCDKHIRIYVYVVDADDHWIRRLDNVLLGGRIIVEPAPIADLAEAARLHRDRYLPPIAIARFWLDELLPSGIDRFLYLDGDVLVNDELDSLLKVHPPEDGLMAAPDFIQIFIDEISNSKRHDLKYIRELECDPHTYFNSGVIYTSRSAWKKIAAAALAFLAEHPERCRSSDQSALNRVARGKVTMLPLRYNYQSEHMMICDPRAHGVSPVIWHFTGGPKPWPVPGWPWNESFTRLYRETEVRLEGLGVGAPIAPAAQTEAGLAHRRRSRIRMRWVYPWRCATRTRKILRLF